MDVLGFLQSWAPTGISGLIYLLVRGRLDKIDEHETRISKIEGICEERGRQASEC